MPTADTRYDNTLRKRSGELKDEADFVPPGLDTLKDFDQKRRRANRRSAKKYGTTNGSRGKETKAWTVNIQEKQYKRNAFFDKQYTGDLFGTRGNYTKSFVYRSRHSMALAMQTMIANITYITTISTGKRKRAALLLEKKGNLTSH